MKKEVYKYTGNMPSKNPFLWYFDHNESTAFDTSENSKNWIEQPKIGDVITYFKSGSFNEITERVLINNKIVYENNIAQSIKIFEKHWTKKTGKKLDATTKNHMQYAIEAINEALILRAHESQSKSIRLTNKYD